jgi:hypothetical protein
MYRLMIEIDTAVLFKEFSKVVIENTVCRFIYRVLLSPHRARQFYFIESPHLPARPLVSCGAHDSDKRNTLFLKRDFCLIRYT